MVAGELAWAALQYLGQRAVAGFLSSAEISFHAVFAPRPSVVLAGLALLIVAEIFREGIKMRADLETAREIQTSLVAAEASRHGPVSIHSRMQPAAEVGGDYYDVIDLGNGRLAFVVADVAGKGLPAALLMTLLRGSLRSLLSAGLRGTALMTALNTHLVANTPGNRMITCFYGELDPATGRLIYVNAGHNPPYLYDGDGRRTLDSTAVVLGMLDDMPFPEASAELRAGARLLLYTDGVTEAENRSGDQFGVERLRGRHRRTRTIRGRRRARRDHGDRRALPRHGAAVRRHHDDAREPGGRGVGRYARGVTRSSSGHAAVRALRRPRRCRPAEPVSCRLPRPAPSTAGPSSARTASRASATPESPVARGHQP